MLKLTLEFTSTAELLDFLKRPPVTVAAQAEMVERPKAAPANNPDPAPAVTVGSPAGAGTDVAAPRKPGRPRKAAEAPTEPAAAPADAKLTEGDVRAALMKVNERHGADGLKVTGEVLKPFGVARISELKLEQYQAVIDAANKAAA